MTVKIAAGRANAILTLNLSLISTFCVLVAAIVVSEIIERLSPNMAPPTIEAIISGIEIPAFSAKPTAIGPTAAIVPTLVPVAIDKKQQIIKRPAVTKFGGIRVKPKFTVESTPPICFETTEKAPAKI